MSASQKNPYIGPRTFQRNEGHLFFGREREARDLIALVASERLVVFYAQSGAGKSSIVNTRLIPNLETKEYEVLPVGRVSGDMAAGIDVDNIYIYNLLRSLEQHATDPTELAKMSLSQFLAHLNFDDKGFFYDATPVEAIPEGDDATIMRRAVVIDQFEELFSAYPEAWEKREDFFAQLAQAMQDDPQLWVVLVMREDYIAALDPYAHLVSNGLRVRYYMQRLGREAALKAVTSPVETVRPYARGVAEKLIDDLCSIKVQKPDGELDIQPGQYVEPVQMQVVCYGLWENLSPEGSQITEKDLQDVGDVNQSLGKYYDRRVNEVAKAKNVRERLIREWFEKKLITAGGIRNMVLQEREKKNGELDDEVIQALQSDLVRAEKRGGATWYELTHDRLVEPILERNKNWFNENLSPLQRQAALWKDQDQNESWLLRDHALEEVEIWAKSHQDELTDTEKEFLAACQKQQAQIEERHAAERRQLEMANRLAREQARSAKRARIFNIVSGVLVVIAIGATLYAFNAKNTADAAKLIAQDQFDIAQHQSNIAHSSELSTIALERSNSQLDLAILLGVKADSFDSNSQTQKALLTLLQKSGRYLVVKDAEDIQSIQYSPDGKTFTSLGKDGITLWDAETRTPLNAKPLNEHYSGVTALAISKDDKIMASGSADGTIVIWDVAERIKLSEAFKAHELRIRNLAFSPDGNAKILASGSEDGTIVLWDVSDPTKPQQIGDPLADADNNPGIVFSIAFSPDGKTLAAGYGDNSITLWNVDTHVKIGKSLKDHLGPVFGLAFTPDGKTLASGSYDDTVILWDVSEPTKPQHDDPLKGHPIDIETIAISPDGKTLASGDDYGNIILWDVRTGKSIGEPLNGQTSWVLSLAFSPDGKTLVSGTYDSKVLLWDLKNLKKPTQIGETLSAHTAFVWGVAFSADGKTLVSASEDSNILFWNVSKLETPQKIGAPLQAHPGKPMAMFFSPDGSLLASEGPDGIILFDINTQQLIGSGSIIGTSPDESIVMYQTLDKKTNQSAIHLLNKETGESIGDPILGQYPVFSPDSKKLIYQTPDKAGVPQLRLWNIAAKKEVAFSKSSIYSAFSVDGQVLVYQTADQDISQTFLNVWDVTTGKPIGVEVEGTYLAISSDNRMLVYQTTDSDTGKTFINVWDLKTNTKSERIEGAYLAFNPDSQTLLYQTNSDTDTMINLWDIARAVLIKTVTSNNNSYLVSQDGKVLAFGTIEENSSFINLINTSTGEVRILPVEGVGINALSANGNVMLYATTDEKGISSINALNTITGESLISLANSNINAITESGPVLAYDFVNYSNGERNILLINASTGQKIGDAIKGVYLNLMQDGRILIYQTPDGKLYLLITNGPNVSVVLEGTYLTTTPDGKLLVYQTFENGLYNIKLWDIENNKKLGEPVKGNYQAISPDGETLVTRSDDTNALIFWDVTKTWPLGDPLTEKTDTISIAALSPDGKSLAFSDTDGITLQDVSTAKIINTLSNEHNGTVSSVKLSPDKNTLLSFGEDGKAILWDLKTFQPLSDPISGTDGFFSSQGKFAVVLNGIKNTTTVWDLTSRQSIGEPFSGQSAIFTPDDKFMTIGDGIKGTTILFDLTSRQAIGNPLTSQQYITFNPDHKTMALSDGNNNTTTLLDLATYKPIGDPILGTNITFSADGQMLAVTNGKSNTTVLFDMTARQIIGKPINGYVLANPEADDTFIVVDSTKSTTTFWEWETKIPVGASINGSDAYFTGMNINTLIVHDTGDNQTSLWNSVTRAQIGQTLTGIFYSNPASPDSTLMSMYDANYSATIIWDLETQKQVGSAIPGFYNPTLCANADNKIAAWFDGTTTTVTFWDLEQDQSLGELELGALSANNGVVITFSRGCETVAIGDYSQNQTILWDLADQKPIGRSIPGTAAAYFSSDGSNVAILDNNGTTAFWHIADATQVGEGIQANAININPENNDILVVYNYNSYTATIWDLSSLTQINTGQPTGSYYPVFTSDDRLIVYGKNGVTLWDVDNNKMTGQPLRGHSSSITNMLFSPDGNILASLASDGIVLTDVVNESSTRLDAGDYSGQFNGMMALSSDGKLTALGSDGTIFVWGIAGDTPLLHEPLKKAPYNVNNLNRLALSPDGKYLIYESNSRLNIYDIDKGQAVGDPKNPIKIEVCCGGAITFSPDGESMFYNDGPTIYRLDEWNVPDQTPKQVDKLPSGQGNIVRLSLIMDPVDSVAPKYLLLSSFDPSSGTAFTQIWDWAKESKIGDPISGDLQIYGSNADAQVLIYKDNDGRLIKWELNSTTWIKFLCQKANRNLTKEEWALYIGDAGPYAAVCPEFSIEP